MGWYTIDNLPPGTYTVTVSKQGYTPVPASKSVSVYPGQTTTNVDFVLIRPPQSPTLRSPANNSTVNNPTPTFDWDTAEGGGNKRYQIQVDTSSNFSQPLINVSNITNTNYTPSLSLLNNTTYYWHVRTSNEAGTSDWSSVWHFTTRILPGKPTLSSPSNGSTISSLQPSFDWDDTSYATSYRIQVDDNSDFSSPVIDRQGLTSSSYSHNSNLSVNTRYYWRVRASNAAGDGDWSGRWYFNTPSPPGAPSLYSPSNGATISDSDDVTLSWSSVSNASSYRLQVANNSSFSNPVVDTTQSFTSYTAWNLSNNTTYYWRVLASNSIGDSLWSSSRYFTIDLKGRIEGDVDGPGMSPSGATVQATGPVTRSVTTGWFGGYTISDLPPGNYTVTVSQSGYTSNPASRYVTITAGQTTSGVDFTLVSIYGAISGDIDVPGAGIPAGTTITASGPTTKSVTLPLWSMGGYKIEDLTPGEYTVTASKEGHTPDPSSRSVNVRAGETVTGVDFTMNPNRANATIVLSSPSSPSTIRNAAVYSPYVRALRSIALDGGKRGSLTPSALSLTTPVTPIVSSGEVDALVNTSRPLPEIPSLSYVVEGEKPEKVELRGSGSNFTGQMYIESTTPEGTASFHYYGVDETGSVSTQIEYGAEFVIDTTIYPDEGGQVSNRDGAMARVSPGALPVPVNITITSPQSESGPQRSLANNLSLPLKINDTTYVALPDSMREFQVQIDGKEPIYRGRRVSTLNEVVTEIKGVTISLPYPDQDQDGIVDNANLDEESLKILQLRNGNWEVIENCTVDKERNVVSAQVSVFTTFMLTGARVITSVDKITAYPNPWYPEKENFVKITFIPLNSQPKVYIYNIAGELVRTLEAGKEIISTGQGYMEASWDGKNDSSSTVSYGVYIYVVECNKGTKKGKIGIIR